MVLTEWYQQLYGPRQVLFNPDPVMFDPLGAEGSAADSPAIEAPPVMDSPFPWIPKNDGSHDGGALPEPYSSLSNRGGVPYANDALYFATPGWSPDISWKTTAKAYGPYMARGPLTGGLRMASAYMNPTKDPAWQEAARQYLGKYAPGTSLTDVIRDINALYAADPNAKVFASDTARGVVMGAGHLADQYQKAVLQTGVMQPHQFAQSAMGFMNMGWDPAAVPDYGYATPSDFSTVQDPATGQWGTEYSGYQPGTLAGLARSYTLAKETPHSFFDTLTGKTYAAGDRIAETAANIAASSAKRAASRSWMEDILNQKTTLSFDEWSKGPKSGSSVDYSGMSPEAKSQMKSMVDEQAGKSAAMGSAYGGNGGNDGKDATGNARDGSAAGKTSSNNQGGGGWW